MFKVFVFFVLISNPVISQITDGVAWVKDISWEEVKQKAIKENKYIYIDAYATWCGPCKRMDKETFTAEPVSRILNDQFLSVKLQMDKTENDHQEIQKWYAAAIEIGKNYHVGAYPTGIFLAPNGELVNVVKGYRTAKEFVQEAEKALDPDRKFVDPNAVLPRSSSGVSWVKGLSWQEVKQKAARENKYIYIDAYATWCGPCKLMDKETFTAEPVAQILNDRFLPVKLQMDKTKNDDLEVQNWYTDAATIGKQYYVRAYPTGIFLSPKGELVHVVKGYKTDKQFVKEIEKALEPGRKYVDPDTDFYEMEDAFEAGQRDFSRMPALFHWAMKSGKAELAKEVSKEYKNHLSILNSKKLYTKENIEFLTAHALNKKSPFFKMFYPSENKVDKVMGKGYAQSFIDKVIYRDIISLILFKKKEGSGGMKLMVRGDSVKDSTDADWSLIEKTIDTAYGSSYVARNVMEAKLKWYSMKNKPKFSETLVPALEQFGIEKYNPDGMRYFSSVNGYAWNVFESTDDKIMLETATKWMKKVVEYSDLESYYPLYIDTYANLLYKLGKVKEAINWEEKSVQICKDKGYSYYLKGYEPVLQKMKQGLPTWPTSKKRL